MPALPGFLHRDRSIAHAGFNRWRVPPAALAIHLCIGQAYAFSVFSLPLSKAIGLATPAPGGLESQHHRLGVQYRDRFPRPFRRTLRKLARTRRTTSGDVRLRALLQQRARARRCGYRNTPVLAAARRLWRDRRYWPWYRLHLARVDTHQVVPRSPRHGNRTRDHGIWRRCDHRLAAVGLVDGPLPQPKPATASPPRSSRSRFSISS